MNTVMNYRLLSVVLLSLLIFPVDRATAGPAESAVEWLLGQVDTALPGDITYERLEAGFAGPIVIEKLRYKDGDTLLSVNRFEFDWALSAILSRTVKIELLQVQGVELRLPEPAPDVEEPPTGSLQVQDVSLPVGVDIQKVEITDVQVFTYGADEPIVVNSVTLKARTEDDTVLVDNFEARAPQGNVRLQGRLQPVGKYPLEISIAWNFQDPQFGPIDGEGTLQGDLETLSLSQDIVGTVTADIQGSVRQVLTQPAWDAAIDLQIPDLGKFSPDLAGSSLSGNLTSAGNLNDYNAQGDFDTSTLPEVGPLEAGFDISGGPDAIRISRLDLRTQQSPMALSVRGKVEIAAQTVDITGEWRQLAWPLTGTPQIESPMGELAVQGTFQDYHIAFNTVVAGVEFGTLQADIRAAGTDQRVDVSQIRVTAPNGALSLTAQGSFAFADQGFQADGKWQSLAWPLVGDPQVQSPTGQFSAQGTPQDYQAQLSAMVSGVQFGDLNAQIKTEGTDQLARLTELSVTAPGGKLAINLTGQFSFADQGFQADGEWQSLAWPLVGDPQVQSPSGTLSASGTPKDYQARLVATLLGPDEQALNATVRAAGNEEQIVLSQLSLSPPGEGPSLDANGEVFLADFRFAAEGRWQSLVWPLSGAPQVSSPQGRFLAKGDLQNYSFELDTRIQGPQIPEGQWNISGTGSAEALEQLKLNAQLLEGEINADLSARWQPQINWQGEISASGLNTGVQWPGIPGEINFSASSQGALENEILQAKVALQDLSGSLRGQTIKGNGAVEVAGEDVVVDRFVLRAGSANLDLAGRLGERWDIDWALAVDELGKLVPEIGGSVQSTGGLSGPREQPQADFKLAVDNFAFGTEKVQRLRGEGRVDVSGAERSVLAISANGLELGGQSWQTLRLEGNGTPDQHTLGIELAGELARIALALGGGLNSENAWQGQLTRLAFVDTDFGDWRLANPAAIDASAAQASASEICLASSPARVCVQGQWDARQGAEGKLSIDRLTPARFAKLIPENITVDTSLSAQANGSFRPDGVYQGQATIDIAPGSVQLLVNGQTIDIALRGASLQAQADPNAARGEFRLDLAELGNVNADITLQSPTGPARLDGRVRAQINDLTLASTFAPQLDNIQGRINADLNVGGGLPTPTITGAVRLIDGGVEVPLAGIDVQAIELAAVGDGRGLLQIEGAARSGPGQLNISGRIDPATAAIDLTIAGQRFQVMNTTDIQAQIAPDMRIAVNEGEVRVNGEITIPTASISPPELQDSGVSVSDDVVIVRGDEPDTPVEQVAQDIFVNLRITMGDDVRVAVSEFKGKLIGSLVIEQTPQLAPRATGSIGVESGEYRIYGQDLEIERGSVLFSGGPVTNPGLDLRVARIVDDVTAGAQIRGTLQNPKLQLFSVPAMPDSSILSYLIFGRAPDSRASSENSLLLRAAAALGTTGGNLVTKTLTGATGLDTFEFEGGSEADAELVMGKYLTPDIYVSYGVGLFEAINTFRMRYQMTKRLSFESSTNAEGTGVDFLYTIER